MVVFTYFCKQYQKQSIKSNIRHNLADKFMKNKNTSTKKVKVPSGGRNVSKV